MRKKLQNFWYYYKPHVLVSLLIIFVITVIILFNGKSIVPDVQIGYVTDGREISQETKEYINSYFDKVIQDVNKDDKKMLNFIPLMGPRVDLEFSTEGSQILLMDGNTLRKYISTGALEPLDSFIKKHSMDVSDNKEVIAIAEGEKDEHIFAIPMNKLKFLLDAGFPAEDYYLTVRVEYKKNEESKIKNKNAFAIMDEMLDYKG